jgi:translation initiation factor 4A
MNAATKLAALNKFRNANSILRQPSAKVLVVYDVPVKTPEVSHVPLIINYGAA